MLTEKTYVEAIEKLGLDGKSEKTEDLVEKVAAVIVPYELSAPPLPISQMHRIEELREALRIQNATGTKAAIILAYATHINAEIPVRDIEKVLSYLRAFILLYPWLYEKSEIAIRRRLASYIDPYPEEYVKRVLNLDYSPDVEKLIDNYHEHNPDRNRALDLYPLLSCLNQEHVTSKGDIGNVKPRPTFHYRLPNSLVDDPSWTIAEEWNRWNAVEILASKPEQIKVLSEDYLRLQEKTRFGFFTRWASRTEEWLEW
jgi:hypothetical protein